MAGIELGDRLKAALDFVARDSLRLPAGCLVIWEFDRKTRTFGLSQRSELPEYASR